MNLSARVVHRVMSRAQKVVVNRRSYLYILAAYNTDISKLAEDEPKMLSTDEDEDHSTGDDSYQGLDALVLSFGARSTA